MTQLDRYVIQRLVTITFYAVVVFTLAWLAPETLFRMVQGISEHKLTLLQGFSYLIYQIPEVLTYCLPISMLFGAVFLFRQMSLSMELIAMFSSGISFSRILRPVGTVGLMVAAVFFLNQEVFSPISQSRLRTLSQETHFDVSQKFHRSLVTFVEKAPEGQLRTFITIAPDPQPGQNQMMVLLYDMASETPYISQIVTASKARWIESQHQWELTQGVVYQLTPEGIYQMVTPFAQEFLQTSPVPSALLSFPSSNPLEMNIKSLSRYVRLLMQGGQTEDARFYYVRLLQRFFLPLAALIFALYGAAIGIEKSRARRNMGLTYAAVLLLLYNITVHTATTLGSVGVLWVWAAAILPLLVAIGLGQAILQVRQFEG